MLKAFLVASMIHGEGKHKDGMPPFLPCRIARTIIHT